MSEQFDFNHFIEGVNEVESDDDCRTTVTTLPASCDDSCGLTPSSSLCSMSHTPALRRGKSVSFMSQPMRLNLSPLVGPSTPRSSSSPSPRTCGAVLSPFTCPSKSGMFSFNARNVVETSERQQGEDEEGYKTVNQYSFIDSIGKGAFSKVKLVIDNATDEVRAMKIMKKSVLQRRGVMDNVHREVALLKKMEHRNIVRLYEVIDDCKHDKLYMVFELLERGELVPLLDDGTTGGVTLSLGDLRHAMIDIVDGVSFLHEHLIFHRDIKPANLLLGRDGRVKVSDLGVAICFDSESEAERMANFEGTPAFLPPEVARGDAYVNAHCVDMWAIGVSMYVALFGRLPFYGENVLEINDAICHQPAVCPDDANALAEDLVLGLLDKNVESRLTMEDVRMHPFFKETPQCVAGAAFEPSTPRVEVSDEDIENSLTSRKWRRLSLMFLRVRSQLKRINHRVRYAEREGSEASTASTSCTSCTSEASEPSTPGSPSSASGKKQRRLSLMFNQVRATLEQIDEQVRSDDFSPSSDLARRSVALSELRSCQSVANRLEEMAKYAASNAARAPQSARVRSRGPTLHVIQQPFRQRTPGSASLCPLYHLASPTGLRSVILDDAIECR